jgi:hypothetical protein
MRTDTYAKVALAVIFASACAACGQTGQASATASSDRNSASTSASGQSGSADDPQAAANRLWATILTHCGDSYHYANHGIRFRQPSFPPVVPDLLTEADRLNGYRWRGWAYLTGKVYAHCDKGGCSEWYNSEQDVKTKRANVFLKVKIWNLNGNWHFKEVDLDRLAMQLPDSGDEIGLDPPTITSFRNFFYGNVMSASPKVVPFKTLTCAEIPGTAEYEKQVTQKQ